MSNKKIEDKYKVLNHIDHVLLRPQTYLGSNKPHTSHKWLYDDEKIIIEEITYVPSFLKIFDELIINSIDESKRNSSLNKIEVNLNLKTNEISIRDNGGIPVVIHKVHDKYVPEVIFGNLMSGSNYDDTESRIGAGTNGYGAKLTNIFSKEFILSTCDGKNKFYQVFTDNMKSHTKAQISKSKTNHTQITYTPDYEKFGLKSLDGSHLKMIHKRVIDIAACNSNIEFYFNGNKINFKSFEDYIKMYKSEYFFEENKDRSWSIAISPSDNGFKQVSFVNSTETYDGGTHVEYITNQIVGHLREFFQKKYKVDIRPNDIRNHIFLFLNSTVINPSFSSQTKEKLITEVKNYGYSYEVSKKMIQSILKSEIVNRILDWIEQKKKADESRIERELNRKVLRTKVDKLIDAKGKERWKCSIAIFEGDCLEENTLVRVLRNGELIDTEIKKISIGDLVITHKNRFQEVTALTKNIQYKNTIKTSVGDIVCSNKHRFFVYDIEKNEFLFEYVYNLNKNKHKLVKNQLCFMDALLEVEEINDNTLKMKSGELFEISNDHKLCVYNKKLDKFEMIKFDILNKEDYLIVNTFTI